jgi:hypothetical protein
VAAQLSAARQAQQVARQAQRVARQAQRVAQRLRKSHYYAAAGI